MKIISATSEYIYYIDDDTDIIIKEPLPEWEWYVELNIERHHRLIDKLSERE